MKEIHDWVPWFKELANKIAERGEDYLADAAKRVEWRTDGNRQPLLNHDDKNIDPFSFIYSVAARSKESTVRAHLYPSIQATFHMHRELAARDDNPIKFIQPHPDAALFHKGGKGDPELLWRLFKGAVTGLGEVNPSDFEGAFDIANVATRKLTQTLFLVNPEEFIPITDFTTSLLPWPREPRKKVRLQDYVDRIDSARNTFPGCELYEINIFAYLRNRGDLTVRANRWYQVSTMAHGEDGDDHWDNFKNDNCVYTGGAGDKKKYPLDEAEPGNAVLVRCGRKEGRGIGVVQRNGYEDGWTEDGRLHVLWLNKRTSALAGSTPMEGFSLAGNATKDAFRGADAYRPTFDLIERLKDPGTGTRPGSQSPSPASNHPRNRILYGPPGTGKTWHAVNHALAIVDGGRSQLH